jgi:hypothetical protein
VRTDVITSAGAWRDALAQVGAHDFVHTFDFHAASEANGDGQPCAFAVRDEDGRTSAFWPLLKRSIGDTGSFDYGSVYGYAGPLFRETPAKETAEALIQAMAGTGAVSVFSRLHPLFECPEMEGKTAVGEVVSIEVTPGDEPPREYRSNHRRNIARLRRDGFHTSVAADEDAFRRFQPIYEAAMDELGAAPHYYFREEFYEQIRQATDYDSFIIFAQSEGEAAAAVLFTVTGDITQYFLSATAPAFKQVAPSKLIIADAHSRAIDKGARHLVLGGGYGGQRDSLFNFKLGFSKAVRTQYIFRRVLDRGRYAQLCTDAGIAADQTSFFPAYRSRRG